MKTIFSLLILTSTFAISSPIPAHMLQKASVNPKLTLIFTQEKVLQRDSRLSRESRDARECRFCLRKMPRTREVRIARIGRKALYSQPNTKIERGKKLAIAQ